MENNNKQEIKIELSPEVANGIYSNRAFIAHSGSEFFLDFISIAPNMPHAKVVSRVIMTPENAKSLLFALRENIGRYEQTFGEIKPVKPVSAPKNNGGIPNPFEA